MAVVFVPNFSGELVERFARNVTVVRFEAIHPCHKFMALVSWKSQNSVFQFSQTHRRVKLPFHSGAFKPKLGRLLKTQIWSQSHEDRFAEDAVFGHQKEFDFAHKFGFEPSGL